MIHYKLKVLNISVFLNNNSTTTKSKLNINQYLKDVEFFFVICHLKFYLLPKSLNICLHYFSLASFILTFNICTTVNSRLFTHIVSTEKCLKIREIVKI